MRVLFVGSITGNSGPTNANRSFVEHWPNEDELILVDGSKAHKMQKLLTGALSDVVLTMGPGRPDSLARAAARARKKPVVGFCHGYIPFENDVNHLGMSAGKIQAYKKWLDDCDVVVTNSALQMRFLVTQQPSLEGKVAYANLGIEPFVQRNGVRSKSGKVVVAVSGGTRPIKANEVVAQAVNILRHRGIDASLDIYGRRYSPNDELDRLVRSGSGRYLGQVSRDEFIKGLRDSTVFVMDSRWEPFGLSALDAVEAGTSVLLSRNCGVGEVLGLCPSEVVLDCEDPEEVSDRIMALVQSPNAGRIFEKLDFDAISWHSSAGKLRNICAAAAGVEPI